MYMLCTYIKVHQLHKQTIYVKYGTKMKQVHQQHFW